MTVFQQVSTDARNKESSHWFEDRGPIADLIRSRHWDLHPLGPLENWPELLRSTLKLMLASALPMSLLWGRGRIVLYNDAYADFIGVLHPRIFGLPVDVAFPNSTEQMLAARDRAFAGEKLAFPDQHVFIHRSGNADPVWLSLSYTPLRNAAGLVEGVLVIVVDVTDVRQQQIMIAEAKQQADNANIAKSEFLANMSHEIRTPMNAIIGLAHILATTGPLTERQQEFIKTLQMSADALLALVNDLLDISKIEAGSIELENAPFSLAKVAEEVSRMMAVRVREKRLYFTVDTRAVGKAMYLGDATRMRQIILNLCSNAVKFTDVGSVTLTVSTVPDRMNGREWISIEVKDTGIGISSSKMDLVFQKFTQADASISRKYGGTGLGLAIVKTLAENMGGTIGVESALRQGSTFTFRVPLVRWEEERRTKLEATRQVGEPLKEPHGLVLLVEDHEPNIMIAHTFLELFGYGVEVVKNGADAVRQAKAKRYTLILMDVQMVGMSGLEATHAIRAWEKETGADPVCIMGMTAHALSGDRERCLASGMNDYLSKPFNPDELEIKIKALTGR